MPSLRSRAALSPLVLAAALSLTLIPSGVQASPQAPVSVDASVEPASKKKGPPPGTTTKQIQEWINEKLKQRYSTCRPDFSNPCTLTIDWSNVRWLGTAKVCTGWGGFPNTCLEHGTAYVARTNIMVTTATEYWDFSDTHPGDTYISAKKDQYGYWDGGRRIVKYQPWPGGPTWSAECPWNCGRDLHVRKGKFGRWFWGFNDGAWYYLR